MVKNGTAPEGPDPKRAQKSCQQHELPTLNGILGEIYNFLNNFTSSGKRQRQQSLFAMHESYGLSAVPTKIVAWLRGGERNKRIASRIVQIKFERERAMRRLHHILFT